MLNENSWGGLSSTLLDQSKQGASSFQQSSKEIRKLGCLVMFITWCRYDFRRRIASFCPVSSPQAFLVSSVAPLVFSSSLLRYACFKCKLQQSVASTMSVLLVCLQGSSTKIMNSLVQFIIPQGSMTEDSGALHWMVERLMVLPCRTHAQKALMKGVVCVFRVDLTKGVVNDK
jgi:hypothetical protein